MTDFLPTLGVRLDDEEMATISTTFRIVWGVPVDVDRGIDFLSHRIRIEVWGYDGGGGIVRGERRGDDLLFTFFSSPFESPTPLIETSTRVARDVLDEDKPRGVRNRRQARTDRDEIYVIGGLEVFGRFRTSSGIFDRPQPPDRPGILPPRWERYADSSPRSEILSAQF